MRTDSAIPAILIQVTDSLGLINLGVSNGAPATTATLAAKFAKGCVLENSQDSTVWINAGTVAAPSWVDTTPAKLFSVTLTAAQMKALRATAIEIVPAVVGKVPVLVSGLAVYTFTTNAYTIANVGDDMTIRQNNSAGLEVSDKITSTGFIDQVASQVESIVPKTAVIIASANAVGASLVVHNEGAAEWTSATGGTVRVDLLVRYV